VTELMYSTRDTYNRSARFQAEWLNILSIKRS